MTLSIKPFPLFFSLLLLTLLAWQSAQLMWQVWVPEMVASESSMTKQTQSVSSPSIQLFGAPNASLASEARVGAPDAQILQGWLLLGIVVDGEHALALVQMGSNGLRWLKMGERLDNGLQVVSIANHSIGLLTAQGIQSLSLFHKQSAAASAAVMSAPTAAIASLQSVRHNLKSNPMSAMQLMRMDPVWHNGQLSGLTLMPQAGQEALFNQLGLKAGDVLVGLNGEAVGAWMSKMADLPKVLDASGARVKVLRAGAETEWTVNW